MNSPGKTGEKEAPLEQRHGIALWTQWTVSPGVAWGSTGDEHTQKLAFLF